MLGTDSYPVPSRPVTTSSRDESVGTTSFPTQPLPQASKVKGFHFTKLPPNPSPAVEIAVWIYDDMRLEEWL